jgi:hypothetical protein
MPPNEALSLLQFERALLIANDIPGMAVTGSQQAGDTTANATCTSGNLNLNGSPASLIPSDLATAKTQGSFQKVRYSASRLQSLGTSLGQDYSAFAFFSGPLARPTPICQRLRRESARTHVWSAWPPPSGQFRARFAAAARVRRNPPPSKSTATPRQSGRCAPQAPHCAPCSGPTQTGVWAGLGAPNTRRVVRGLIFLFRELRKFRVTIHQCPKTPIVNPR